jgi:hypothetical protein
MTMLLNNKNNQIITCLALVLFLFFFKFENASAQWSGWESFEGSISGDLDCGIGALGEVHCFARDLNGSIQHLWSGNGRWHWDTVGHGFANSPTCVWKEDNAHCFARDGNGSIQHLWSDNGRWSQDNLSGNIASSLDCVGAFAEVHCFARDDNGNVQHLWSGNGRWNWDNLGGVMAGPLACHVLGGWDVARVVLIPTQDQVHCFAHDDNGNVQHLWSSNGGWNWDNLGGNIVDRLDCTTVLGTGTGGPIYPDRGQSDYSEVPAPTPATPDVIHCFARTRNSSVAHLWSGNGVWNWANLGGNIASRPDCLEARGIHCFALGVNGSVQHLWSSNDGWSWENLGGIIVSPPSCFLGNYEIHCFGRVSDGTVWHLWGPIN